MKINIVWKNSVEHYVHYSMEFIFLWIVQTVVWAYHYYIRHRNQWRRPIQKENKRGPEIFKKSNCDTGACPSENLEKKSSNYHSVVPLL